MSVAVRYLQAWQSSSWDSFVDRHPDGTAYHRSAWGEAVRRAYGHLVYQLAAFRDGVCVGGVPLARVRGITGRTELVSQPFADLGGMVATDAEVEQALWDEAVSLAGRLGVHSLELRTRRPLRVAVAGNRSLSSDSGKVSMLLDLPEGAEALFASFKSKLRSQIRKAEKNGVTFRWAEGGDADAFYAAFCRNMRDLGSPVHSRRWLESVLEGYGERARLGVVLHQQTVIGGGVLLFNGGSVCIPWASTVREYNHLAPNMLLYWRLLEYAAERGCTVFDFGRSTPGEGTHRFKAQWGALPKPLYWNRLTLRGAPPRTRKADSGRERAAELWQRLPLVVANRLGPLLRGRISL